MLLALQCPALKVCQQHVLQPLDYPHLYKTRTSDLRTVVDQLTNVFLSQVGSGKGWLSCLPLKLHNFVLRKTAFV